MYEQDGLMWNHAGDHATVFDQLQTCVHLLRENPGDRRVVISIWDPSRDLAEDVKDVPCNTHMYPRIREEKGCPVLELTVCCRSNDIIWGATGANAVHFSFVQEWMAAQIGVGVERDIGAVQAQVFAPRDFLDIAVKQRDALGVAGRELVEEVAGKKLGAEVALFFGFDEGGVREDH